MASFNRSLKRKKKVKFQKDIKKTMKTFEKSLRCKACSRVPNVIMGEKLDDWHMKMEGGAIELLCPECREVTEDVEQ